MEGFNLIYGVIATPFYLVAVLVMIWGGIIIMTSSGNPEKLAHGKRVIFYDIVGIIVATASWQMVSLTASLVSSLI